MTDAVLTQTKRVASYVDCPCCKGTRHVEVEVPASLEYHTPGYFYRDFCANCRGGVVIRYLAPNDPHYYLTKE